MNSKVEEASIKPVFISPTEQSIFEVRLDESKSFSLKYNDKFLTFPIPPGYGPPHGGLFLTRNLGDVADKVVRDIGTGFYGLNAVAATLQGAKEGYGVDVDPRAVEWITGIIDNQKLSSIHIVQGESLHALDGKIFDVIVGNLPMLPALPDLDYSGDYFHYGGETGWEIIQTYLDQVPHYLTQNGSVRFLLLDFLGINEQPNRQIPNMFERLKSMGMEPTIVASEESVIQQNHPFVTVKGLFDYVKALYPEYDFFKGRYNKVVVEGVLRG